MLQGIPHDHLAALSVQKEMFVPAIVGFATRALSMQSMSVEYNLLQSQILEKPDDHGEGALDECADHEAVSSAGEGSGGGRPALHAHSPIAGKIQTCPGPTAPPPMSLDAPLGVLGIERESWLRAGCAVGSPWLCMSRRHDGALRPRWAFGSSRRQGTRRDQRRAAVCVAHSCCPPKMHRPLLLGLQF